jgi:ketosteroid isomerase-like protein
VEYSALVASNVESARGSFDAFKRGDVDRYLSYFSEDVEWRVSAFVTGRDAYRGHAEIREFFDEIASLDEDHDEVFSADYDEFLEAGEDKVVALGQGEIKRERDPLKFEVGLVYTFADGKITLLEGFTGHQEALSAAGLSR